MYKKTFDKVHVLLYEDFKRNPEKCLHSLLCTIGEESTEINVDVFSKNVNYRLSQEKLAIKIRENRIKSIAFRNNKYLLRLLALLLSFFESKSNQESPKKYIHNLVEDFYKENNHKLLIDYPQIPLANYPTDYQL